MPIEALEGTDTLPVPAALLGPGEHYALEVAGDSMVEEGILDGDYALIRKTDTARDGEIVVALINEEEATLKTFRREGQMIRLDPANRHYDPQRYRPEQVQHPGPARGAAAAVLNMRTAFVLAGALCAVGCAGQSGGPVQLAAGQEGNRCTATVEGRPVVFNTDGRDFGQLRGRAVTISASADLPNRCAGDPDRGAAAGRDRADHL